MIIAGITFILNVLITWEQTVLYNSHSSWTALWKPNILARDKITFFVKAGKCIRTEQFMKC